LTARSPRQTAKSSKEWTARSPHQGTARSPKEGTARSPHQTAKPSTTTVHSKPSITEKKAALNKHPNTGDSKRRTPTGSLAIR
jgi:hypothetical protein